MNRGLVRSAKYGSNYGVKFGVNRIATAATALLVLGSADARAADDSATQAALRARALAANCSACHGTDGRAPASSALPSLAGQPKAYLIDQMKAYKSGARAGTVMPQLAKGFSDAQIEQLAAWFEKAPG